MKAIFNGTISDGLSLHRVVSDHAAASAIVSNFLSKGVLAEALEIKSPQSLISRFKGSDQGQHLVIIDAGIANGCKVYGPFLYAEDAENFGEAGRNEGEEWSVHDVPLDPAATPA